LQFDRHFIAILEQIETGRKISVYNFFNNSKGVIRICKSKEDRQCNGKRKRHKM